MKIGGMNHPRKNTLSQIDHFADLGFDFVDLTDEWPSNLNADPKTIKHKLKERKMGIVGHTNPTLPAIYPIDEVKKACLNRLKQSADFFLELGATKMNIHPFYYSSNMDYHQIIEANIELLQKIQKYCQKNGLALMLENYLPPFDNAAVFAEILQKVPSLKIHLDIGHLNLAHDTDKKLDDFLLLSKEIIHYHIHDNNGKYDDHLTLGCGTLNWPEVAKKIKKTGYNDTFTLEVFCPDHQYLLFSKERWQKLWQNA